MVADSFVFSGSEADEFWIGSYASPAVKIRERLESHIIADDVTINDQSTAWGGVTFFGTEAEETARALRNPSDSGFVFTGRRGHETTFEWVAPVELIDAALSRFGPVTTLTAEEMERRRIEAGIPLIPVDLGPNDLPNEGGLETDAISYTKGCYLGQEVMARLKAMGQVRRRLLRVTGPEIAHSTTPTPLFAGDRRVGELRSVAPDGRGGLIGLAMLTLLRLQPEIRLAITADGSPLFTLLDAP